jgi:hypothetical protein
MDIMPRETALIAILGFVADVQRTLRRAEPTA